MWLCQPILVNPVLSKIIKDLSCLCTPTVCSKHVSYEFVSIWFNLVLSNPRIAVLFLLQSGQRQVKGPAVESHLSSSLRGWGCGCRCLVDLHPKNEWCEFPGSPKKNISKFTKDHFLIGIFNHKELGNSISIVFDFQDLLGCPAGTK